MSLTLPGSLPPLALAEAEAVIAIVLPPLALSEAEAAGFVIIVLRPLALGEAEAGLFILQAQGYKVPRS